MNCTTNNLEEVSLTVAEEIAISKNSEITSQEIITDYPYWAGIYLYPAWNRTPRFVGADFFNYKFHLVNAHIVGPQDPTYNCIAWSIEDYSMWLEYPLYAGIDEFVEFYTQMQHSYHKTPTTLRPTNSDDPFGVIDLFAKNNIPTHASRRTNSFSYPDYFESKLGSSYTIRDVRSAVTGPTYGDRFLSMYPLTSITISRTQIETIKTLVKNANPEISFSTNDINIIRQEVEKISFLRDQFEALFEKWKYEWNQGYMKFSNNTRDAVTMQEFKDLATLGKPIIPFIIEKMLDKSNFFAVRLYEELHDESLSQEQRKVQLKAKIAADKKILYQSVQNEAAIAVQNWIQVQQALKAVN